jgi:Peptidase propeptide and YPEB domain
MRHKRLVNGAAAVVLVAVGLLSGSTAFALEQPAADPLAGGSVFAQQQPAPPPPAPPAPPPATLTWNQARSAALSAVPGTVLEMEWEWYGGRAAYEVEIRPQGGGPVREVLIDASNGAVLRNRVDGPDFRIGPMGAYYYDDD